MHQKPPKFSENAVSNLNEMLETLKIEWTSWTAAAKVFKFRKKTMFHSSPVTVFVAKLLNWKVVAERAAKHCSLHKAHPSSCVECVLEWCSATGQGSELVKICFQCVIYLLDAVFFSQQLSIRWWQWSANGDDAENSLGDKSLKAKKRVKKRTPSRPQARSFTTNTSLSIKSHQIDICLWHKLSRILLEKYFYSYNAQKRDHNIKTFTYWYERKYLCWK